MTKKPHIVVLGGGTGTFTVLTGLKKYPARLTAIVAMSDDGGSSGILRDELGVLPPGDVRQCLVALSKSGRVMRELFNYRFPVGKLKGHSFGNLFLSALEKITGSFDAAVRRASDILRLKGEVIPSTLDRVNLAAELKNGKVIRGEDNINKSDLRALKSLRTIPKARANPRAVSAIAKADLIIFAPGDLYTSILPNILIKGIRDAVRKSKAKKVFVCNLMNKKGHTDNFNVQNFVEKIEDCLEDNFDYVIYNKKPPSNALLKKYILEGERPVLWGIPSSSSGKTSYIGGDFVSKEIIFGDNSDALKFTRSLIRHNPDKLAKLIFRKMA